MSSPSWQRLHDLVRRLVSPEYLTVSQSGPLGRSLMPLGLLGIAFLVGLAAAVWTLIRLRRHRPLACFELWVCLGGLLSIAGRFLSWPGWSARVWPVAFLLLAAAGGAGQLLRARAIPAWLTDWLGILALRPTTRSEKESRARFGVALQFAAGISMHLAGIALILRARYGLPLWLAPLVLAALLAPQATAWSRRRLPRLAGLIPLLAAYAATLLWLAYRAVGITVVGWQGRQLPNPFTSLFYVDGIALAAAAYSLLCQAAMMLRGNGDLRRLARWATLALLTVTTAWSAWIYLDKRTHGATASDPYAYAQMGVDLAEHGTFLHRFSLFEQVIPLGIAWAPLQPVGYHIPRNSLGDCPSVWATGASVLLAAGYRLIGEQGLYLTTPLIGLSCLLATWLLVQELLSGEPRARRNIVGALTVALLATSPEFVDRLLVPMADAAAQLFTVLMLLFALRCMRLVSAGQRWPWTSLVLAGLCYGWATWVRHTQLLLGLPLLLAMIWRPGPEPTALEAVARQNWGAPSAPGVPPHASVARRIKSALGVAVRPAVALGSALLATLPDIAYRWRVFGGPLATETTELPAMSLRHVGAVTFQFLREALAAGEWGYLFPFALAGLYLLLRRHRRRSAIVATAFALILGVHLTYRFFRLRDLISIFPLICLFVAYGAVRIVAATAAPGARGCDGPAAFLGESTTRVRQPLGRALLPALAVGWVVLSLALARWSMIDDLWKPGWASFGYMRAAHRTAFDRLAEITPPDAVIAASLNAGAVTLYTGRDAIRPYESWTEVEWQRFLDEMRRLGRPVYLLDDGGLMADFIADQQPHRRLTPIQPLPLPLFYTRDREEGWLYRLEWQP